VVVLMSLMSDDAEQIGFIVTSTRIFELGAALPLMLSGVILPVMTLAARDDPARLRYVIQEMTQAMALGGALILIVILLAAEPILQILGGSEYVGAAPVLRVQGIALFTLFVSAAWSPALIGMHRQGSVAIATAVGLAVVIVAGLILIPLWEAEGAAAAAALADAVVLTIAYTLLRRAGPGRDLRLGFALRLAVAAAVAMAVALIPGLPPLVDGTLAALLFVGAAFALRIVPADLGQLLPGRGAAKS